MHSQAGEGKISWEDLNQEMANLGSEQFDAETFKQVYDTVPAIKNFVDSFDPDGVTFKGGADKEVPPEDTGTIDQMAQRATQANL